MVGVWFGCLLVSPGSAQTIPAAEGTSLTAGSASGMTATAGTSSTSYVDLQTLNFTAGSNTSGLFDVAGAMVILNTSASSTAASFAYQLDGVGVGPPISTVILGNGYQSLPLPAQLTGVAPGNHVLKVLWAAPIGGSLSAYTQSVRLTGYNTTGTEPAASGVSVTAGSGNGLTVTAATSSTSYSTLQTLNFTSGAATTGLYNLDGTVAVSGSSAPVTASVRYMLDSSQVGPAFTLIIPAHVTLAVPMPLQLSGLSAGDHQLTVQWASPAGSTIPALTQSFHLTGFNAVGGTAAASGAAVTAGSSDGSTVTATAPAGGGFVNLQTLNFNSNAPATGHVDLHGAVVLSNPSSSQLIFGLRYQLDGTQVGSGFTMTLFPGEMQPVSMPMQLTGVSTGNHQLTVQWAVLGAAGSTGEAYSQSFSVTGYNAVPVPEPVFLGTLGAVVIGIVRLRRSRIRV
jgi:hypothetical protein